MSSYYGSSVPVLLSFSWSKRILVESRVEEYEELGVITRTPQYPGLSTRLLSQKKTAIPVRLFYFSVVIELSCITWQRVCIQHSTGDGAVNRNMASNPSQTATIRVLVAGTGVAYKITLQITDLT